MASSEGWQVLVGGQKSSSKEAMMELTGRWEKKIDDGLKMNKIFDHSAALL